METSDSGTLREASFLPADGNETIPESDFNEHNSRWKRTARNRSMCRLYPPRDNTNRQEPPTVDGIGTARSETCHRGVNVFPACFPAFISLSVSERDAVTQPLISEQQRAGGDRFAKTNNLISCGAALISSAQNSLEKL